MELDREELLRRLNSPRNLVNSLDRSEFHPGTNGNQTQHRCPPVTRAPVVVRATAGALACQSSVREISREFNLSPRVVREATHSRDPVVKGLVDGALDRVRELAIDKLMESLGLLTEEKVAKGSAKDISAVAANMSRVIDRVTPKQVGGNVQLIVYAPTQRSEKDFDVVEV